MSDELRKATERVVRADERWREAVGSWLTDDELTVSATGLQDIEELSRQRHEAERAWIEVLRRHTSQRARRGAVRSEGRPPG